MHCMWRGRLWVRFGYDPASDRGSYIYQMVSRPRPSRTYPPRLCLRVSSLMYVYVCVRKHLYVCTQHAPDGGNPQRCSLAIECVLLHEMVATLRGVDV